MLSAAPRPAHPSHPTHGQTHAPADAWRNTPLQLSAMVFGVFGCCTSPKVVDPGARVSARAFRGARAEREWSWDCAGAIRLRRAPSWYPPWLMRHAQDQPTGAPQGSNRLLNRAPQKEIDGADAGPESGFATSFASRAERPSDAAGAPRRVATPGARAGAERPLEAGHTSPQSLVAGVQETCGGCPPPARPDAPADGSALHTGCFPVPEDRPSCGGIATPTRRSLHLPTVRGGLLFAEGAGQPRSPSGPGPPGFKGSPKKDVGGAARQGGSPA
jgi:hypothetical protein